MHTREHTWTRWCHSMYSRRQVTRREPAQTVTHLSVHMTTTPERILEAPAARRMKCSPARRPQPRYCTTALHRLCTGGLESQTAAAAPRGPHQCTVPSIPRHPPTWAEGGTCDPSMSTQQASHELDLQMRIESSLSSAFWFAAARSSFGATLS